MSTTIQPVASEMSSTPRNGKPWNFNGVLEVYQVPKTVATDKKLPPGARLLWGVIRACSFRDGRCCASDETLAQLLAVSERQVIRYIRSLESAALLRTNQRPGKTPIRELLWDSRFAGKIRVGVDTSVRGGRQIRQGGVTDPSDLYKERGILKGNLKGDPAAALKSSSENATATPAPKPAQEWTEEDYIARGRACGFPEHVIQMDLERLRARRAKPQAERMVKASDIRF